MIAPVPVDTRINRRQRRGFWKANCWASAPPHDTPRTSTWPSIPIFLSNTPSTAAKYGKPYGRWRVRRAAGAGHVEAHDGRIGIQLLNERIEDFQAGADAVAQHQRHPGPWRTFTRICWPSTGISLSTLVLLLSPGPSWVQDDDVGDTGGALFAVDLIGQREHRLDAGGLLLCARHGDGGAYL